MKLSDNNTFQIVLKVFPTQTHCIQNDDTVTEYYKSSWFQILIKISGWNFNKPVYITFNDYLYWYLHKESK